MKKPFLVLVTCLLAWGALPASAASFFPQNPPYYGAPGPLPTPPSDGGVAGPELPLNPLGPFGDRFEDVIVTPPPQPPSAVPLPAAAWLFGSAILGLAGYKRRKRS